MPQPHIPDNDITFAYVKELSESIRSISNVMQGFTTELHQHALVFYQLKNEFNTHKSVVESLTAIIRDGQGNKESLVSRVEELERDNRDMKKEREEQKQQQLQAVASNKSFRAGLYVAIITAVLSVLNQYAPWNDNKPSDSKPSEPVKKAGS